MYIETSSPRVQGDKAKLNSPLMNFTGHMCLEFVYHMYGSSIGTLSVVINGSTTVFSVTGSQGNGWLENRATLSLSGIYMVRHSFMLRVGLIDNNNKNISIYIFSNEDVIYAFQIPFKKSSTFSNVICCCNVMSYSIVSNGIQ